MFFPEQGQVIFRASEQRLNVLTHLYQGFSTSHIQAYLDGFTKRTTIVTKEFNATTKQAIEGNLKRFIQVEFLPEDVTVLQFSKVHTRLLYSEDINQVVGNLLSTYKLSSSAIYGNVTNIASDQGVVLLGRQIRNINKTSPKPTKKD